MYSQDPQLAISVMPETLRQVADLARDIIVKSTSMRETPVRQSA
jgi:hypothetical protein